MLIFLAKAEQIFTYKPIRFCQRLSAITKVPVVEVVEFFAQIDQPDSSGRSNFDLMEKHQTGLIEPMSFFQKIMFELACSSGRVIPEISSEEFYECWQAGVDLSSAEILNLKRLKSILKEATATVHIVMQADAYHAERLHAEFKRYRLSKYFHITTVSSVYQTLDWETLFYIGEKQIDEQYYFERLEYTVYRFDLEHEYSIEQTFEKIEDQCIQSRLEAMMALSWKDSESDDELNHIYDLNSPVEGLSDQNLDPIEDHASDGYLEKKPSMLTHSQSAFNLRSFADGDKPVSNIAVPESSVLEMPLKTPLETLVVKAPILTAQNSIQSENKQKILIENLSEAYSKLDLQKLMPHLPVNTESQPIDNTTRTLKPEKKRKSSCQIS